MRENPASSCRHSQRMFELRAAASIFCNRCPAIGPRSITMATSIDHWLDGERMPCLHSYSASLVRPLSKWQKRLLFWHIVLRLCRFDLGVWVTNCIPETRKKARKVTSGEVLSTGPDHGFAGFHRCTVLMAGLSCWTFSYKFRRLDMLGLCVPWHTVVHLITHRCSVCNKPRTGSRARGFVMIVIRGLVMIVIHD